MKGMDDVAGNVVAPWRGGDFVMPGGRDASWAKTIKHGNARSRCQDRKSFRLTLVVRTGTVKLSR